VITALTIQLSFILDCSGWLSRKQLINSDAVFTTFESVWPDLYRYVVQSLNPKMDVCHFLSLSAFYTVDWFYNWK